MPSHYVVASHGYLYSVKVWIVLYDRLDGLNTYSYHDLSKGNEIKNELKQILQKFLSNNT